MLRRLLLVLAALAVIVGCAPADASTWTVGVAPSGSGAGQSMPVPPAPASATATCVGLLSAQVVVSWAAVPGATSYTVYASTVSAAGPYGMVGSGATSTWTSGALLASSYWFEVSATVGTNWVSPVSAVAGPRVILLSLACL